MEQTEFLNGGGGGGENEGNGIVANGGGGREEDRPSQGIMTPCIVLLRRRVHYLPIITAIFITVSLVISYAVSVGHGHVEPDFPYISHTAIQIPERCIFAQLINMGAVLMGFNVYIRFLQQREQWNNRRGHRDPGESKERKLIIASFFCGCISAFGLSMVANFQTKVMRGPHYFGAGLAFFFGLAYCWLQTSISFRHRPRHCVTIAQLVISILLSLFLFIFAVSKSVYKVKESRGEGTKYEELRGVYLVSTISEWLTVLAVVVFALTFCPDFSTLDLHEPRVQFFPEPEDRNGHGHNVQLESVATTSHGHD